MRKSVLTFCKPVRLHCTSLSDRSSHLSALPTTENLYLPVSPFSFR
jgi:hypothetical protein